MPTGIYKRTDEVKKNMSLSHKHKGMTGKHHSDETKMKIRLALQGFKHSEETKKKLSIIRQSKEYKAKLRIAMLGFKHSEETKKKISLAGQGRKFSKETRLKISRAHLGKKLSEETKKKISLAKQGAKINSGSFKKGHKMSVEIRRKIGFANCGKKNWNWKGGISSENSKIRNSVPIKLWRKEIFKRDTYICRTCGQRGHKLEAHHLLSFTRFPQFRFCLWNGITLCENCHKLTDNYKGKGKKQWRK